MTHYICGKHPDGCYRQHRYSLPVERVAYDVTVAGPMDRFDVLEGDTIDFGRAPGQPPVMVIHGKNALSMDRLLVTADAYRRVEKGARFAASGWMYRAQT